MTSTLFSDTSYYQPVVNNSYPYALYSFRANDGTFRDPHFYQSLAWSQKAVKRGKLKGYFVYFVFEENWKDTLATYKSMVGTPSPYMAVMIDVESWSGKITGSHSSELNELREDLIQWLNHSRPKAVRKFYAKRDRKRVMAYANQYDRQNLWSSYHDTKWVIANYSYNPQLADQKAHQFSQTFYTPPFGRCDINSVDGHTAKEFVKEIGITGKTPAEVKATKYPKYPLRSGKYFGIGLYDGHASVVHRNQIKIIQRALVKGGFAGKVNVDEWCDGHFDSETKAAVLEFKKKYKLNNKKGYVGRTAWNRLVRL